MNRLDEIMIGLIAKIDQLEAQAVDIALEMTQDDEQFQELMEIIKTVKDCPDDRVLTMVKLGFAVAFSKAYCIIKDRNKK